MHFAARSLAYCLIASLLGAVYSAQVDGPGDLFAGMDPDGRIERPEIPDDIKNPERWRYTPSGRIVPGNILDRFLISSFFSPLIFRADDVGTGGGVALTDIDFRNQDYQEFANIVVTYTSEGQQAYTINWLRWLNHRKLPGGGIIREDRSVLSGGLGYSKTLTRRFYGLGSRTLESSESSYTEALSQVGLGFRRTAPDPGDNLLVSGAVRFQHHALERGRASSVPSTDLVFAKHFADGDDVSQLWIDLGIAYDSRDSIHQPYRGSRVGFTARTAALQSHGEFGGSFIFDAQTAIPLPGLFHNGGHGDEENPPTDVLAIGGSITDTHGDLPFYSLPSLGGNSLRGYGPNRFTHKSAAHATIEYRFGVISRGFGLTRRIRVERVNLALFYDVGTVARNLHDLTDGEYLDSVGIGARISFSREASFRIDYGISDEGANLTIGFGNTL